MAKQLSRASVVPVVAVRSGSIPRSDAACYVVSAVLVASGLVHLVVALASTRAWEGPLSWRKPASFGASFGVTLATVTWVSGYLVLPERRRRALLGVFALDCVVEVTGISVQAWRDVPSHFNVSTPANAVVAYVLAAGGFVLVVVLGVFAAAALRGHTRGPDAMRPALRAGFTLLFAGLLAGVAMIARGTVLVRTGHPAAGYDEGGFLKLFHGVTIHAVLVLPALAWWLDRLRTPPASAVRVVRAGAALYFAVALAVLGYSIAVV